MFLPEFALSPQGSFMEDATEDQFLTYRYDDQVSDLLFIVDGFAKRVQIQYLEAN